MPKVARGRQAADPLVEQQAEQETRWGSSSRQSRCLRGREVEREIRSCSAGVWFGPARTVRAPFQAKNRGGISKRETPPSLKPDYQKKDKIGPGTHIIDNNNKHRENRKTLPFEHCNGCQCVKLFLLKDVTITTVTTVTITTVTRTTITYTTVTMSLLIQSL